MTFDSGGFLSSFRLAAGPIYTVVMTPTTSVINLRGRVVPFQFIQVANSVTVTGQLTGSTITATTILVPVNKDGP